MVFRACGGSTMVLTLLAGAALAAGWVEIMRGPLGQVNLLTIQLISKESLNTLAPLTIAFLFLVRCGPLLAIGYAELRRRLPGIEPHGLVEWLWFCRRELIGAALGGLSLFVYFLVAEIGMAVMITPGEKISLEIRDWIATIQWEDFSTGLVKTLLFVLVATLLCCRQGFRCVGDHSHWPSLVSDAILQSLMIIFLLELFWVGLLNRVVLA
jgi:hypothetical protein